MVKLAVNVVRLPAVLSDRVRLHLEPGLGQRPLSLQWRRQRVQFRHSRRCHGVLRTYHPTRRRRPLRKYQRRPAPQVRRHRRHGLLWSAFILTIASLVVLFLTREEVEVLSSRRG